MKILPEYFDRSQFAMPDYDHHFTIKRPYTTFAKSMNLAFEDYYTNLKLQCVIFDKIWLTCLNIYGIHKATRKHRCIESKNYFNQCLSINMFFANDKKYFPHYYGTSEYYNVSPHHDFIDVEPNKSSSFTI